MPLPEMHGRTHIPSGYAMVVKPTASSTLITAPNSSDAIPATVQAAPPAAVVEWIQFVSTTNLTGGGLDTLSWTFSNGNYNSGAGKTFDIPGTNPQICRDGVYLHMLGASNLLTAAGKQSVIRMDFTRVSGPTPASTSNAIPGVTAFSIPGPVADDNLNWFPQQQRILSYGVGAFSGTPSEFQVQAFRTDDGAFVADSAVTFSIDWIRLGDAYS